MKKSAISLSLVLCLLLAACGAPAAPTAAPAEDQTTHIVATTYPVYLFTTAVTQGVEGIEVTQLVNQQTACLHDYTLTVNDMTAIEKADVIVMNGAGLADFMDDALASSSADVIDASAQHIYLADSDEGGTDPHVWMDPQHAYQMTANIAEGLMALDPDRGDSYIANMEAVKDAFDLAAPEWTATMSGVTHKELITFHDGFGYFARHFGLDLLKAIEEEEGAETSAAEIKEIVDLIQTHDIPAIFTEKNGSDATAQAIARETGVKVYQLDMIMSGDGTGIQPYLDAMTADLNTLAEALG